ncbi:MAG: hypothetical protein IJZ39_07215 [Oscillospiraceae bacterium]|nr:hypothetical protein [Oscillospiraceae bacterium]
MILNLRNYTELSKLRTFEERYRYLQLRGRVGEDTFGFDRWINQLFYHDKEWLAVRDKVIIRDNACDLGMLDREIKGDVRIIVHHMNPISKEDILRRSDILLNPEYLICCLDSTHKAIHYGDENLLIQMPVERRPFDTCPWRA